MSIFSSGLSAPAQSTILPIGCESSVVVGDLVRQSLISDNTVATATDNLSNHPVIGIVQAKLDDTNCIVLILGKVSGFSGLTKGNVVFVGATGLPTTAFPVGNRQIIGVALSESEFILKPDFRMVIRG
jgi:hypothetical protein